MNLFYDPTDGVLLAPGENGGFTVVQTNAQLDPSRISLSKEGYLTLLDFQGKPYTMSDENGNPISLKGEDGAILNAEYLNDVLSHTCGIPQLTKTYDPGNMVAKVKLCHFLPAGTYKVLASMNIDNYDAENEGFADVCIVAGDQFDINKAYALNTVFTITSPSPIYLWYAHKDFIHSVPDGSVASQFTITVSNLRIVDLAHESGIDSVTCEEGVLEILYTNKQGQSKVISHNVIGPPGVDGENPFTEDEVLQLQSLPLAMEEFLSAVNRIDATIASLQSRIETLEQALLNIDLSGLSVAYPVQKEE